MKTVLGLICSPRRLGNAELMIGEIDRQIPEPHRLRLLRLSDFRLRPCRACYLCLFKKENCVLQDDLSLILDALSGADGLIWAVPAYFLSANSALKKLVDRGLSFYGRIDSLWGKPSVGVAIAGIPGKEGSTLTDIHRCLAFMGADIKALTTLYAALPGEILQDETNRQIASHLGSALFGRPLERDTPACPQCGGTAFQFASGGSVHCLVCSNAGTMTVENNRPRFDIQQDNHPLFRTKEDALRHRDWLRQEVKRFGQQREALQNLRNVSKPQGEWIKPATDSD